MGFTMPRKEKIIVPDVPRGFPHPPRNVFVTHPFIEGALDIRWDNPTEIPDNIGQFQQILGVNIYRSFDSAFGPWDFINESPIQSLAFRDITENILIHDEDVTNQFVSKDFQALQDVDVIASLTFKVQNYPIVKPDSRGTLANDVSDVEIYFLDENGERQEAAVANINALEGEVTINTRGYFDPVSLKIIEAKVPDLNDSATQVFCTYFYNRQRLDLGLDHKVFYKLTTVAIDEKLGRVETPLEYVKAVDGLEFEKLDWIWREAIRRNKWILEQGGERVKVMIRKWIGEPCGCINPTLGHQSSTCLSCYGTGIAGGYEGPFDIIIPPPDTERQIPLTDRGHRLIYSYDCWTSPTPRLTERDIIIKPNGERYIVGPVTPVLHRGVILQQSFSIQYLEIDDIRYRVKLGGTKTRPVALKNSDDQVIIETAADPNKIPRAQTGKEQVRESELAPYISNHCSKDDNNEEKGRTRTFENITY